MPLKVPPMIAALSARLSQIGFERTRRALAGLALSIFVSLYLVLALNAPDGFGRVFVALAACYGVAFLGVVAEWFWGRWFANGLAWSGIMIAIAVTMIVGWAPALAIYGGIHLLVLIALMGQKMATRYDLQEAWRTRFKVDEFGVARLQKAVTSAAASLPSLIVTALAPKEEGLVALGALAAALLAVAGLRGLVRVRSWGVLALGGAFVTFTGTLVARDLFGPTCACPNFDFYRHATQLQLALHQSVSVSGLFAFIFLAAAALQFAPDIARYLRRPSA